MKYLPGGLAVRKSLEVIRCTQCHYAVWTRVPIAYCMKMGEEHHPSYIRDINTIPDWCPLEDWPEE